MSAHPRPYRSRTARATVLFPDPELPRSTINVRETMGNGVAHSGVAAG
jgi:hypothetical protein